MTGDFNPGTLDTLNRAPLADAKAMEAGIPRHQHADAPRWADPGTIARAVGVVLLGILLLGWLLTLTSAR